MKAIIFSLLLIVSINLKAQTIVEFYNNTSKPVYAAYAIWDNSNYSWTSIGWYKVEKYSTLSQDVGNYTGSIYIHGKQDGGILSDGSVWGNQINLCIDPKNAFQIRFANKVRCNKTAGFNKMSVKPGTNKWTFNP